MPRKRRFIVNFSRESKEEFLAIADKAVKGLDGNPDFADAPVTFAAFKAANDAMVAAAPSAVHNNIDGLRVFKPLRETVEGMLATLGEYGQSTIGNDPEKMNDSGLPQTKEPEARPDNINVQVDKPRVTPGNAAGKVDIAVKPNRAADGIVIYVRQADMTYVEKAKILGFRTTLTGFAAEEVVVLQLCYWNNAGLGPMMGRPMAIVA